MILSPLQSVRESDVSVSRQELCKPARRTHRLPSIKARKMEMSAYLLS
jgi:hypothetical protein